MKCTKRIRILLILLVILIMLSSCDKPIVTISPGNFEVVESESPSIEASPIESPYTSLEPSQTVQPTSTIAPTPTIEPTPTYTFTPSPTPIPERPSAYTDERYFTFDAMHGIILDYDIEGGAYVNIPDKIGGVVVEQIGKHAFAYKGLYGVIIPDTVRVIGESAFANNNNLMPFKELTLGKNVEVIKDNAFDACCMNSLILPDKVMYIGASAFSGYKSDIVIPDSTEYIGVNAFASLSQSNITLGKKVTSFYVIEGDAIAGYICKPDNNLVIPTILGVDTIKDRAFAYYSIESIIIPEGIRRIGNVSFFAAAKNITIPDSVISMGNNAISEGTVISCTPGSFAEYYTKKIKYDLSGNFVPVDFPVDREGIFSADISEISGKDYSYPFENWLRLYLNSKYSAYEITYLSIDTNCIYPEKDDYDITNTLFSDEYKVIAKYCRVNMKTNKDIPNLQKSDSIKVGYDYYDFQVVALHNAEGKVVLSGFIENKENLLITSDELYSYIKEDTRFIYNEFTAPSGILGSSQKTEIINVSDYNVVNDIVKDVDFTRYGGREEYVPISKDVIAFTVQSPSSPVYMVNLKTNEVLFSKEYDNRLILSSESGVCVIRSHTSDGQARNYDYLNDKGQIINQITEVDNFGDIPINIPGTSYKLTQENRSISMQNISTGSDNILLQSKTIDYSKILTYYLGAVIDSNRFIYSCYEIQGLVPGWTRTYIYDIRDGSSLNIHSSEDSRYYEYAGYYGGRHFIKFSNTFDEANKLYVLETEGANAGSLECITDNVDSYLAIRHYSISSDGKYLFLITSNRLSDEMNRYSESERIAIVDIQTKAVIYQDEYIQEYGSVTYLEDGYFCMNNGKTLIYLNMK